MQSANSYFEISLENFIASVIITNNMKTSIIIHGHFYQPPRENPFTGIVPIQESALPCVNWNEAIYKTCYRPNAYSRYLSENGKVINIINNYENISFNFGPTLLNWINTKHPDFIEKLIEADTSSIKRLGHSNAIAQSFNHTILPLANRNSRRVQIAWAIEDYIRWFSHSPEGFWCPECAINEDVIDDLAEFGIRFVILSPWQASTVDGNQLKGKAVQCDTPFIIHGKKKSISAFFYDGDYASGISFGHYLRSADSLMDKIIKTREERNNPPLIHWATDGEIYGHHEPFGDMALAALSVKITNNPDFELTNYGAYLDNHPAEKEVVLWNGNDGLGSSWSCCHGVGRWYKDCGCHTGGDDTWNQKWRSPMYKAFCVLEDKAEKVFIKKTKDILGSEYNAFDILKDYGKVLCNKTNTKAFIKAIKEDIEERDLYCIAELLDCMKNVQFMFTSCGWFFNDISGIEPVQNIMYAYKAAQVIDTYTDENITKKLLSTLKKAQSNIKEYGNGEIIALSSIPKIPAFVYVAGCFIIRNQIIEKETMLWNCGYYQIEKISDSSVCVTHMYSLESRTIQYSTLDYSFELNIKDCTNGEIYNFNLSCIDKNILYVVSSWLGTSNIEDKLNKMINESCNNIAIHETDKGIRNLLNTVAISRNLGFKPEITLAQDIIFPILRNKGKEGKLTGVYKQISDDLNFEENFKDL